MILLHLLVSKYFVCNVKSFWLCSWNVTYDNLLGSNKPFHQPIPLSVSPALLEYLYNVSMLYHVSADFLWASYSLLLDFC